MLFKNQFKGTIEPWLIKYFSYLHYTCRSRGDSISYFSWVRTYPMHRINRSFFFENIFCVGLRTGCLAKAKQGSFEFVSYHVMLDGLSVETWVWCVSQGRLQDRLGNTFLPPGISQKTPTFWSFFAKFVSWKRRIRHYYFFCFNLEANHCDDLQFKNTLSGRGLMPNQPTC